MKNPILLLIAAGVLTMMACTPEPENNLDVIAQVNEAQITNSELESQLPDQVSSELRLALKRELMERWIEDEIFFQEAERQGFELAEDEQRMVENYRKRLIIQRYLGGQFNNAPRILDKEIDDYYDQHRNEFVWDEDYVHVIHLVMENEDRNIFEEIRKSSDLMEVIKKNFLDLQSTPERPNGDLGYLPLAQYPDAIQRRLKNQKTGSISRSVKTNFGYHFVQLLDYVKAGEPMPTEVARTEIENRLKVIKYNKSIEGLKKELRKKYTIQTDISKLNQP
jgi:hypothetical protein